MEKRGDTTTTSISFLVPNHPSVTHSCYLISAVDTASWLMSFWLLFCSPWISVLPGQIPTRVAQPI